MSTIGVGRAFRDNAREAGRRRARRQHTVDRQKERRDRHDDVQAPVVRQTRICPTCQAPLHPDQGLWTDAGLVCPGCVASEPDVELDRDLYVAAPIATDARRAGPS